MVLPTIRRSHAQGREEVLIGCRWENLRQHYFQYVKVDHDKAVEANKRANWYFQRLQDTYK